MKYGGWVPLSKMFLQYLPKDRPYTKLEAAYCLQLDYDLHKSITVSGYSALWQWSRKKVSAFLKQMNVQISYPENTSKKQNQKGQIRIQIRDRYGTDKEQIRLIDFNDLPDKKNRQGTDKGQIRDRSGSTTIDTKIIDTNKEKNKKEIYLEFVRLTKDEYKKLVEKYNEIIIKNKIEDLNDYIGSKGKKYKSHYHTILSWLRKDKEKKGVNDSNWMEGLL